MKYLSHEYTSSLSTISPSAYLNPLSIYLLMRHQADSIFGMLLFHFGTEKQCHRPCNLDYILHLCSAQYGWCSTDVYSYSTIKHSTLVLCFLFLYSKHLFWKHKKCPLMIKKVNPQLTHLVIQPIFDRSAVPQVGHSKHPPVIRLLRHIYV